MSALPYVVALGPVDVDEYYYADYWPKEGEKAFVQPTDSHLGGMVHNAAVVFAKLGHRCCYYYALNNSKLSEQILTQLTKEGIDTSFVKTDDSLSDPKCIIVRTKSERTILIVDGKKPNFSIDDEALQFLGNASCIYTSPAEANKINGVETILPKLNSMGAKIVFDVEKPAISKGLSHLLPLASYLFFNEEGWRAYLGKKNESQAVNVLLDSGVEVVTVTLAANGSKSWTKGEFVSLSAEKVDVLDTTGAGDTFNSVFTSCLLKNQSLRQAATSANIAASEIVARHGTIYDTFNKAEIELKIAKNCNGLDNCRAFARDSPTASRKNLYSPRF